MGTFSDVTKRMLFGRALHTNQLGETLLPKRIALPVFASDALSSNGYATQEILLVLSLGGYALYQYAPWVAAAVILVFLVVVLSYRQNVHAYPSGGGDYEVVSTNLGPRWGVFVASALMVDYVLTVAVSISSAVANAASAIPWMGQHSVALAVGLTVVLALINLRGVRESGSAFAIPTYAFIFAIFTMLIWAGVRMFRGDVLLAESADWVIKPEANFAGAALVFLIARAFSSGTTALTGIEAISNGVPAFRKPKSKNAATTLAMLGAIAMTMFAGITWLAVVTKVKVAETTEDLIGMPPGTEQKTVIAQVAQAVFSNFTPMFVFVSVVTALILVLAANTAFNGFPVLGSILARDGYLPRQLHTRGDRLAFSNGIVTLAGLAVLLIYVYQANVSALIQLYIIGVFVSFTLSQLGMIKHWNRHLIDERDPAERGRMKRKRLVNGVGFCMTGTVLVIVLVTKFAQGAWIVVIAMPLLFLLMESIRKHYDRVSVELVAGDDENVTLPSRVHAIVLVSKVHKPTLRALAYARATRPTVLEAVTVDVDDDATARLVHDWERRGIPVALKVLDSPYREVTRPVVEYVRGLNRSSPRDLVCVYVPEYVVGHWWEQLLHNQSALRLKTRLLFSPGVMVVSVPWQLLSSERIADEPEAQAPGALRRAEPDSETAEAYVAGEMGERAIAAVVGGMAVGDRVVVEVGAVAHGGHCVARHEGQVIFVRHALPGERVEVRVTSIGRKARFVRADAVEVLVASPDRRSAPCPVASQCGGCDWQHVTPGAQRGLKAAVVREAMTRFAGISLPDGFAVEAVADPVPSEGAAAVEGLGWRTRGTLGVDRSGRAGFLGHRSHRVVVGGQCPQLHLRLAPLDLFGHTWPDGRLGFASPSLGEPVAFPESEPPAAPITEWADGRAWKVAPDGFWQVHPGAADALVGHVRRMVEPRAGERLVDLYAGVGLFGLSLAGTVAGGVEVTLVEGDRRACELAAENAGDLQATVVRAGVDRWVSRVGALEDVDVVVLDPPRTGAGAAVVEAIASVRPRAVAYVACDPVALARDVATFRDHGLVLDELVALDLFPTTHHVECVAKLVVR